MLLKKAKFNVSRCFESRYQLCTSKSQDRKEKQRRKSKKTLQNGRKRMSASTTCCKLSSNWYTTSMPTSTDSLMHLRTGFLTKWKNARND